MGNRAVIATEAKDVGVYLHWNGGRDSVEPFLTYCNLQGFRSPEDDNYGWARLCQVIGNFFEGGLSVGVDKYDSLDTDNKDNGTYIIKDWKITDRLFFKGTEQKLHDFQQILLDIDSCQPVNIQLGEEVINNYIKKLN